MDNHMDNNPNGNRPDNNKGPGRQDPNKNHQSILAFLVCLLVTLVCFAMFTNMLKDNSSEITYDKFIEMVDDGDVKEVTLQSNTLTITPKHQSSGFSEEVYYANQMESVDKLTERLEGTGIKFEYKKPDAAGEIISMLVSVLLPTIVLFVLLMVFMRVGAATETEMKEAKLRMEDALAATRAAVEEGIIAGGGGFPA